MRKAALIPLALLGLLAFLPFAAADFPETWDSIYKPKVGGTPGTERVSVCNFCEFFI